MATTGKHSAPKKQEPQEQKQEQKQPSMYVRVVRTIMIVLMAACLVLPNIYFTRGKNIESPNDNRYLAEMPEEWSETWKTEFETYMNDRIGFRNEFITLYQAVNDRAFKLMAHPLYTYGLDGYAFFDWTDGGWSDEYLAKFADFILKVQVYCEERGVPFLYVITPSKAAVYSDKVPDYVPPQQESTDQLVPMLEERGVNYLDLTQPLIDAKNDGVQVYNKVYDAGHWNSEGMHVGSAAIIDKLNEMGFDIEQIDMADYTPEYTLQTKLTNSDYPINEMTYIYWANEDAAAVDQEEYREAIHMNDVYSRFWYWHNDKWAGKPNLLMFQGSYFNTQGTMLYNQFENAALVHDYFNILRLPYYFEVFDPDVVIFETAAYTTRSEYYDEDDMVETVFPKPWSTYEGQPVRAMGSVDDHEQLAKSVNSAISDFWVEWQGDWITSAYAVIDGKAYDTIIEDGQVVYWAVKTSDLSASTGVLYGVCEDGTIESYDFTIAEAME